MAHISKCRAPATKINFHVIFQQIQCTCSTQRTQTATNSTISILHFESKGPPQGQIKCRNWGPRSRKCRKLGSASAWLTCKIMQRHVIVAAIRHMYTKASRVKNRRVVPFVPGHAPQTSSTKWEKPRSEGGHKKC